MQISAQDILRMQLDLAERLADPNHPTRRAVNGWINSAYGAMTDEDAARFKTDYAGTIQNHVALGTAYHVEPDMVDLTMYLAEHRMDSTSRVSDYPPPSMLGWCVFGKPMWEQEILSRWQASVAVSWGPCRIQAPHQPLSGFLVTTWAQTNLVPDDLHWELLADPDISAETVAALGGWIPNSVQFMDHSAQVGPARITPEADPGFRYDTIKDGWRILAEGTLNNTRTVCQLWRLMGQTLSSHRAERPSRQQRRWMARHAKFVPEVQVVTLRRETRQTLHPGSGQPLAYRVPVEGHWRNQAYGPGRTLRRRIWINDFERGPEGAPYRVTKKVRNLAR